jgi:hypothetical protein
MTHPGIPTKSNRKLKEDNLNPVLERGLFAYAAAAGAAGVSLLALTLPAEAKIVFTPAHTPINLGQTYKLDINGDGVTDFTLKNAVFCNTDQCFYQLTESPATTGNEVVGIGRGSFFPLASALAAGAQIGSGLKFQQLDAQLESIYQGGGGTSGSGKWLDVRNHFLGLRFQIDGQTHFGWARLTIQVNGVTINAILTGYAYETEPDTPIIAGKTSGPDTPAASLTAPLARPATLGLLALGAPGLSIWRRNESV